MKLKHTYTDQRLLKISDKEIIRRLEYLNLTESTLIALFGERRILARGYLCSLLEILEAKENWSLTNGWMEPLEGQTAKPKRRYFLDAKTEDK